MNANPNPQTLSKLVRAAIPLVTAATASAAGAYLKRRRRKRSRKPRQRAARDTVLQAPVSRGRIVRNRRAPSVRIKHREYLFDVDVSTGVDYRRVMAINPGITFPWLKGIAGGFEKYRFHSLKFEYVTATATATTGAIALAPEYDPDDRDYSLSKAQLYMFDGVVRGPLWNSITLPFRCPSREYFVREASTVDESLKWHDPGQLIVDVTAPSVTSTIGEIWAEYDITLRIPEYESPSVPADYALSEAWQVGAAGEFIWPESVASTQGLEGYGIILRASVSGLVDKCRVGFWKPGTYILTLHVSGATAFTGMGSAAVSTHSGWGDTWEGPDDAITKNSEVVSGTACTAVYTVTVGHEYYFGTTLYQRSPRYPVYVYLGAATATGAPTDFTLTVS